MAANQAARRGLGLVVPLTIAGQASTPGSGPRSPAEARQADPYRSEQRLTVLLVPSSTAASPCGSRDSAAGAGEDGNGSWEEEVTAAVLRQAPCNGDNKENSTTNTSSNSSHDEDREGGALVVPRATTDAVTRVIFAGIRQQAQHQEQLQQHGEDGEDRLGALERLVVAAAGDAVIQNSIARRIGGEAHAAFQRGLLLRPRVPPSLLPSSSSALLTAAGGHRPATSSGRLPAPLPPSPFEALPAGLAPEPHQQHFRKQSRNFEATLSCSICLLPLHDAHVLDCGGGHTFCGLCIDQLLSAPAPGGIFGGGPGGVPSVARFFSILNTSLPGRQEDEEEEEEAEAGRWSFFRWLGTAFLGPARGRRRQRQQQQQQQRRRRRQRRVGFGVERRCPECRKAFTTSIPVRRINDIVDRYINPVRTLLPDALDAEDIAEQERRARKAAAASSSSRHKRARGDGGDESLPSSAAAAGAGDMDLPAWVMTLVCLVVVVAMAVGRP